MKVDAMKATGDAVSITVAVGALVQILPSIAALLTIIWTGIRIYETATVQRWLRRDLPPAPPGE